MYRTSGLTAWLTVAAFAFAFGAGLLLILSSSSTTFKRIRRSVATSTGQTPPVYLGCGKQLPAEYNATERILARVRCRLSLPRPVLSDWILTLSGRRPEREPYLKTFFVINEMPSTADLGDFLFISAATIGVAEATARKSVFSNATLHVENFLHEFQSAVSLSEDDNKEYYEGFKNRTTTAVSTPGVFDMTLRRRLDIRNPPPSATKPHAKVAVLRGAFQSWKYFHKYKSLLDYQFVFNDNIYEQATSTLTTISGRNNEPKVVIGVHVSRKKAQAPGLATYGYAVANKRYFQHAIAKMNAEHSGAMFVVVSDDLLWCRSAFADIPNVVLVDSLGPAIDMAMLTLVDHLILSVGSLGWWSAYMGDAQDVMYYKHWPKSKSGMAQVYSHRDYFLPHWIALD